jgi:hypothetical protein
MLFKRVPADFSAERQHFALADPGGADQRLVIAPPLVGYAPRPATARRVLAFDLL